MKKKSKKTFEEETKQRVIGKLFKPRLVSWNHKPLNSKPKLN